MEKAARYLLLFGSMFIGVMLARTLGAEAISFGSIVGAFFGGVVGIYAIYKMSNI